MTEETKGILAATRLAPREVKMIEKLIRMGVYLNTSEFIREAVRDKIENLGETKIVLVREGVTKEQAKKEILEYAKQHPGSYVSDAADALGIDIELAFEAMKELLEEKEVYTKENKKAEGHATD